MPTLRRRNSNPGAGRRAPLRSSLASAAWAVEDRVVWGMADVFRSLVEVVRWPFERIAWAVEHWLVWPIQEETALWSRPTRAAVLAGVVLLAGAGVAAGIVISNPSGGSDSSAPDVVQVSAPTATPPVVPATARDKAAAAVAGAPVLHGSTEIVPSENGGGVTKAEAATEPPAAHAAAEPAEQAAADGVAAKDAGSTGAASGSGSEVAGPAAIAVAKKFSGAFVLYETGHDTAQVKAVFHQTATPDLAQALLKRPPRLPANVKVPEAKVLNIVAGPKHGDTYTLSVSLLRVGVTSELRLDMQKTPSGKGARAGKGTEPSKPSEWLVTDVLG